MPERVSSVKRMGGVSPFDEPVVRINLVGPFRVTVRGREIAAESWTGRRSRSLLKLLALWPPGRSVDELIEMLWPDADPEKARLRLYEAASRVRRTLTKAYRDSWAATDAGGTPPVGSQTPGESKTTVSAPTSSTSWPPASSEPGSAAPSGVPPPGWSDDDVSPRWPIRSCRSGYQLEPSVWVDIRGFHDGVARLHELCALDRASALHFALRLTPPHPEHVLVEDAYEDWAQASRERVREDAVAVYRLRGQLLLESNRDAEALQALLQILTLNPVCEKTACEAMALAHKINDRGTALAVFHGLQHALRTEVGVGPAAPTVALYRHIASGSRAEHQASSASGI